MATTQVILKAVELINPTAEMTITENDLDTIVWESGTTPISKSDIEAQLSNAETALEDEQNAKDADKTSGNQKLLDLGLTQAEVDAITK